MIVISPYLRLPRRSLAEVRGKTVRHMPDQAPTFLMGPDEITISMAKPGWRKRAIIWTVALAFLVLGFAFGPHAALYFQMLVGE